MRCAVDDDAEYQLSVYDWEGLGPLTGRRQHILWSAVACAPLLTRRP